MKFLKDKHANKDAVIIMGGPSAHSLLKDLKKIDREKYVIFLESKALTRDFVLSGVVPDYYLLPYPEKSKDNTFQSFVFQSLKANVNLKPLLKPNFHEELEELLSNKDRIYEEWRPHKGKHKSYRYCEDVVLKTSPFDLLGQLSSMHIISRKDNFNEAFSDHQLDNEFHYFKFTEESTEPVFEKFMNPEIIDNDIYITPFNTTNSAATATFPLMNFLGINKIYLFGFDGTLFGNFEDNADKYFKSRLHFYTYLILCRHAFSFDFKISFPMYLRPKKDLEDVDSFALKLKGRIFRIKTISKQTAKFKNIPDVDLSTLFSN